jgi:hypothetical protein
MKRIVFIFLFLLLLLPLLLWWRWQRHPAPKPLPSAQNCINRAEEMVAKWKAQGKDAAAIEKMFEAEIAKCSGVTEACAAMTGAVNADLAWLGRALLSGSMSPADYLARVRDRTRKMRAAWKDPAVCDAYAHGDADGDLVPDDRDKCPHTPSFQPTNAYGCSDTSPPPPAPSSEAIQEATKGLNIPLSKGCMDAPVPDRATVLKAGVAPDEKSFLFEVSRAENEPAACQVFYEVDIRIRNVSFFAQRNVTTLYHKVFRAANALGGPLARPSGMVFQLLKTDPNVPWNYLTFHTVEPGEISERYFRVRTVNGNGLTQGWGAFTLIPSTTFP